MFKRTGSLNDGKDHILYLSLYYSYLIPLTLLIIYYTSHSITHISLHDDVEDSSTAVVAKESDPKAAVEATVGARVGKESVDDKDESDDEDFSEAAAEKMREIMNRRYLELIKEEQVSVL